MIIQRNDLLNKLEEFSLAASGVVLGDPGCGKSHTLWQLKLDLESKGIQRLLLPVEQLGDGSESELRSRLDYKGTLVEWLKTYITDKEKKPGILIFDGFDAARNEIKRERILWYIRDALSELDGLWNVLVCVRTYDAKKSKELLGLFGTSLPNDPIQYKSSDVGISCRHFSIPLLKGSEIESVFSQIPRFQELYQSGTDSFRSLMKLPFNIWLVERLLAGHVSIGAFSSASTETQLLGLFWQYRMRDAHDKDDRSFILTKITKEMVKDKALSCRKEAVYEPALSGTWIGLFSDEILINSDYLEQRVAFRHNILFDYAVSVLLIEEKPEQLIKFVTEDPSRPLFLRPSITYYFTRLWHENASLFWECFWDILPSDDPHLKVFSRLVPPLVVVSEALTIEQLDPVIRSLDKNADSASNAVLRILQALRTLENPSLYLWAQFLHQLSKRIRRHFVGELAVVNSDFLDKGLESGNSDIVEFCASTARNILGWIWESRKVKPDGWLDQVASTRAVPMVAKTYKIDPIASKILLQEALKLIGEKNFNINYIFKLADNIGSIWTTDPGFVSEVYFAVFGHQEVSKDPTHMGGIVLSLVSNRRQDYEMCYFVLTKEFPKFLRSSPVIATETAVELLNKMIIDNRVMPVFRESSTPEELSETFSFGGVTCVYLQDASYSWDELKYADEPLKIGDELKSYLVDMASEKRTEGIDSIIGIFKSHASAAYFWRKLLQAGITSPSIFADRLSELCVATPVLIHNETRYEVGEFLKVASRHLDIDKRSLIEEAILLLPSEGGGDKEETEYLKKDRDRLLACIPEDLLVLDESRKILARLKRESMPINRPVFEFYSYSEPFSQEDWLKEKGVDVDKKENQTIRQYFPAIERFTSTCFNMKPTLDSVTEAIPQLMDMYRVLSERPDAEELVLEIGWAKLGSGVAKICEIADELPADIFNFCRQVILDCASSPFPKYDPKYHDTFDSPGWSSSSRVEAAQGIVWIASRKSDRELLVSIRNLCFDKVPSVRYLTIRYLSLLSKKESDYFWQLVSDIEENEKTNGVRIVLCMVLDGVLELDVSRTVEIIRNMLSDYSIFSEKSDYVGSVMNLLMRLVITHENQWAIETLNKIIENPLIYTPAFVHAGQVCVFTVEPSGEALKSNDIFERAYYWLDRNIEAAASGIREITKESAQTPNKEAWEKIKELYDPIDFAITQFQFALDIPEDDLKGKAKLVSEDVRREFYFKIKPLLEKILAFSSEDGFGILAPHTAHSFIKLLSNALKFDPKGVLSMAHRVVKASEPYSYNLDSMAVNEVVRLVETILADHRKEVREGEPLDDLLGLLDVFAKVGWVDAIKLVWRLDEVFR